MYQSRSLKTPPTPVPTHTHLSASVMRASVAPLYHQPFFLPLSLRISSFHSPLAFRLFRSPTAALFYGNDKGDLNLET